MIYLYFNRSILVLAKTRLRAAVTNRNMAPDINLHESQVLFIKLYGVFTM